MEAKATARFLLMSPQKVRLVANEIRGLEYPEAVDALRFMPKKGARLIEKVLKSARANMNNNTEEVKDADLFVKKIYIDAGPVLKRWRPRARGRGMRLLKRTSHITIVLGDEE